jgi:hypothetical protein
MKILVPTILVCALLIFGSYISINNNEVRLRNSFAAQQKVNESSFDKLWKIIKQQSGVANSERDSFRKTFSEIMESQKGIAGNGSLASFFSQAKIDISPSLFQQLMTTIEAQRENFHRDQMKLIEIKRMHDNALTTAPSSWLVGTRPALELKIITSARTNEVFSTGEDNEI